MAEKCWYYFHNSEQVGPMVQDDLVSKLKSGTLSDESLVFKTGWKKWASVAETKKSLGLADAKSPPPPPPVPKRKAGSAEQVLTFSSAETERSKVELVRQVRSPRRSVSGQVIVHNNDNLIFAQSANISAEGVFIKTEKPIFYIGEILKITCRILEVGIPFNAEAQVVRRSSSSNEPSGYGLYFTVIKPEIVEKIRKITLTQKAS